MVIRSLISMGITNHIYPLSCRYDIIGNKAVSLKRYAYLRKRYKLLSSHCRRYRSFSDRGKSYMFIKIYYHKLDRISTENDKFNLYCIANRNKGKNIWN